MELISELVRQIILFGIVSSNHSNRYITLLALFLRALRSTHAEVNGTEEEKGGERRREQERRQEQ